MDLSCSKIALQRVEVLLYHGLLGMCVERYIDTPTQNVFLNCILRQPKTLAVVNLPDEG